AFSVAERQLHGLLLNMRRVVSRIYGALFRGSLGARDAAAALARCDRNRVGHARQRTQSLSIV
ncbi:hypothetical protein NY667_20390, partial [Xanthomonas hortorum pv. hederae]